MIRTLLTRPLGALAVMVAGLGLGAPIAAAQDMPFTPGLWEIKRQRSGGPGGGVTTQQVCFTAAQFKSDPAAIFKTQPPPDPKRGAAPTCELTDIKLAAGKVSYVAVCATPMGQMRAPTQGVYSPTSFSVSGQMRMGMMRMTARTTAKRLGDCDG